MKSIEVAAENRAAGMLVALDTLTMVKCATRKFSDPQLQQTVDESQARLRQFLSGVATVYDPENFLAQTPQAQIAAGGNGSTRSLRGNSSSSNKPEPEGEETNS